MSIHSNLLLLFLLCCLACSKEDTPGKFEVNVPPVVQPYVDQFLEEAAVRGKVIDLSKIGLEITFQDNLEDTLAAFCSKGAIVINNQFWETRNDVSREAMIFHELGHCILNRNHYNAMLANDEWRSMMRGDPIPAARSSSINYSGVRREYYIDELFNQNTSEPSWVRLKEEYALSPGSRDTILSMSNIESFTRSMSLPDSGDFEIEVLIDIQNNSKLVGLGWGGEQVQDQIVVHYNRDRTLVINEGLKEQGIIYQHENFPLLDSNVNLLGIRRRGDKYHIFINQVFVYWMDVRIPFVNRFDVLADAGGPPNFREIYVYKLKSI
ncbi:MAG: hypothetical protein IPL46_18830 [Saprospiraceae bacterium]|nr:hypothetical protein [Saprospiraceae bacterium]